MRMSEKTNPRKVTTSGGMTVVSLPDSLLEETGIEKGDRLVLEPTDTGFTASIVSWTVRDA